jgi:hypothetical protein
MIYKFVELSIVSDDMIEKCVNQWVSEGWTFDGIRFVTSDASRRPTMAFVSFVRDGVIAATDERDVVAEDQRAGEVMDASPVVRRRNALADLVARNEGK